MKGLPQHLLLKLWKFLGHVLLQNKNISSAIRPHSSTVVTTKQLVGKLCYIVPKYVAQTTNVFTVEVEKQITVATISTYTGGI